ncbi:hypothetical protein AVEN_261410-1, partial [Araneus ventricosus]
KKGAGRLASNGGSWHPCARMMPTIERRSLCRCLVTVQATTSFAKKEAGAVGFEMKFVGAGQHQHLLRPSSIFWFLSSVVTDIICQKEAVAAREIEVPYQAVLAYVATKPSGFTAFIIELVTVSWLPA